MLETRAAVDSPDMLQGLPFELPRTITARSSGSGGRHPAIAQRPSGAHQWPSFGRTSSFSIQPADGRFRPAGATSGRRNMERRVVVAPAAAAAGMGSRTDGAFNPASLSASVFPFSEAVWGRKNAQQVCRLVAFHFLAGPVDERGLWARHLVFLLVGVTRDALLLSPPPRRQQGLWAITAPRMLPSLATSVGRPALV